MTHVTLKLFTFNFWQTEESMHARVVRRMLFLSTIPLVTLECSKKDENKGNRSGEPLAAVSSSPSPTATPTSTPTLTPTATPDLGPLVPLKATIVYDQALVRVGSVAPLALVPTNVTATLDTTHTAAVQTSPGAAASVTATISSSIPSIENASSSRRVRKNAYLPWTATITMDLEFPDNAQKACAVQPPYASLVCLADENSFSLAGDLITGEGVTLKAYAKNGAQEDMLLSNTLPTLHFKTQKVLGTGFTPPTGGDLQLTAAGSLLYFFGRPENAAVSGFFLYRFNGTTLESFAQMAPAAQFASDQIRLLRPHPATGALYFFNEVEMGQGLQMFVLSGTTATQITPDGMTAGRISAADYKPHSIWMNGKLYYHGLATATQGLKIFRYDPVANVIQQITNISGSAIVDDVEVSDPFVVHNDAIYFRGRYEADKWRLYRYSEAEGLRGFANIGSVSANWQSPTVMPLVSYQNMLVLRAADSEGKIRLHTFDGTNLVQIAKFSADDDLISNNAIVADQTLYVDVYNDGVYGLYAYDAALKTMKRVSPNSTVEALLKGRLFGSGHLFDRTTGWTAQFAAGSSSHIAFGEHVYYNSFENGKYYLYRIQ
jgi:hypothetical protein